MAQVQTIDERLQPLSARLRGAIQSLETCGESGDFKYGFIKSIALGVADELDFEIKIQRQKRETDTAAPSNE